MSIRILLSGALLALAALAGAGCTTAPARDDGASVAGFEASTGVVEAPGVTRYRLDNGLQIVVKEDHRAPVVTSQVWYKVGSAYEAGGITGISHVLEHMMFKGTRRHGPGEFSRIISELGGRENAFTGPDATGYFQILEKSRLPVALELEADRMRNLVLLEEEFRKEVKVVMEERRLRTEDNPQAVAWERLHAAAFVSSPYHNPVVGWMDDLESLTLADLEAWYARWYAPNNAVLLVVGDVEPEAVHALAKRYFGPLAPSEIVPPKPRREIEPLGERRVTVKVPAELPYLFMGYQAPVLATAAEDWEPYALAVAAGVLDGGQSARLASSLVRGSQTAAFAGAGYDPYSLYDTLFTLVGVPSQGVSAEDLEAALRAEVARLRDEPVGERELARVQAEVVAGQVYEEDSLYYQARLIGTAETAGLGLGVLGDYVEGIRAVTPDQVRAVARKYLSDDRLTVAVVDPQPMDSRPPRAPQGGGHGH